MSQALLDAIYAKLTAVQTAGSLYADIGGRFYQSIPNQTVQLPCVVYAITSDQVEHFFGGTARQRAEVTFELIGPLGNQPTTGGGSLMAQDVGELEAKLYSLINGVSVSVTGHDRGIFVCLERGIPTTTDDSHRMTARYSLTATSNT